MEGDPKAVKILKLFILGIFMIVNSYGQISLQEKDRIFLYSFSTDKNTQQAKADPSKRNKLDEIVYVLRMPKTWTRENETLSRKSKIPSVRGVICICTWMKTAADLKDKIATYESSSFKHIIQFADENNLALLTWSNFGGYEISSSVDEMNKTQVIMRFLKIDCSNGNEAINGCCSNTICQKIRRLFTGLVEGDKSRTE